MKANYRLTSLFAAALSLTASSARADEFSFSYVFGRGYLASEGAGTFVSGTFDGTLNGNSITNITNATLSIDGVSQVPILAEGWALDAGDPFLLGAAVVSLDGTQNNFVFVTSSQGPASWFISFTGSFATEIGTYPYIQSGVNYVADALDEGSPSGGSPVNSSWTVTDLSSQSSVPDGGTTAAMLGAGMIGLVALRRKLAKL